MPRIKKEDEFYTMLKEFAALIVEAADEYHKIICEFPESMSSIPQMKVYESKADERVKAIMAKLYTSFITPIDREDISSLALAMDDVVDSMYGVAVRLDLFNIGDLRIEAKQISELTLHAVLAANHHTLFRNLLTKPHEQCAARGHGYNSDNNIRHIVVQEKSLTAKANGHGC